MNIFVVVKKYSSTIVKRDSTTVSVRQFDCTRINHLIHKQETRDYFCNLLLNVISYFYSVTKDSIGG